jgi:hypothetical protein
MRIGTEYVSARRMTLLEELESMNESPPGPNRQNLAVPKIDAEFDGFHRYGSTHKPY